MKIFAFCFFVLFSFSCVEKQQDSVSEINNNDLTTNKHTDKKVLINIITEEYPPYNYTEDGELKGFSVEIVKAIMNELQVDYPITVLPGARGKVYIQNNPDYMLFSLFRTEQRENLYKWIGPISNESNYFFKNKNDSRIYNTIEDTKKVERISTRHEGMVLNYLKDMGFDNLAINSNNKNRYKVVAEGLSDLLVNPASSVKYRLKKYGYPADTLIQTNVELFNLPLYIACSKEMDDEIINDWQNALDKIKTSGEYDRIYNGFLDMF